MIRQITPAQLASRLDEPGIQVVDVREAFEHEFCRIADGRLIPLRTLLGGGEAQLDPNRDVVVYCHHGGRSMQAALYLQRRGFDSVLNLAGGIEAWSLEVDPSVPRY